MKRIILSVTNDLVSDQRAHKIATSLMKAGAEVTLFGFRLKGSQPISRQYRIRRIKLLFKKGPLFYAEYNLRLFFYLLFKKADILVSNDLDTLLANYLVSKIRRKKLVYDSHEYFLGLPELIDRPLIRNIWQKIEKHILPKIKHSYTVCESIALKYSQQYGIKMGVVRNVPYRKENIDSLIDPFESEKRDIIIYQGALNIGRGIETAITSMQYIEDALLVIVGDGYLSNDLKKLVEDLNLDDKVLFTGKIPFENLFDYTKRAGIGFSLEENIGLNYYFALPNKLFDYIQANIPVLVSDLPEMKRIVDTYNIGMVAENNDPKYIASLFKEMLSDKEKRDLWKENLKKAADELCWENEEKKLLDIYKDIL